MHNIKVSFDFDSTLSLPHVQLIAERHLYFKDDVYIVTSRKRYIHDEFNNIIGTIENNDLFEIADELGIKHENIYFTESNLKIDTLLKLGIQLHYEDDDIEIEFIEEHDSINVIKIR